MTANKPTTFLDEEFQKITDLLPYIDHQDTSISKASVGWHLAHSVIVMDKVYETLAQSDPKKIKGKLNLLGRVAFALNFLPRGIAKSPKAVLPPEIVTPAFIEEKIVEVKKKLNQIDELDDKAFFQHFAFGTCDKKTTKGFLKSHTHHHLKIVRDILKKTKQ